MKSIESYKKKITHKRSFRGSLASKGSNSKKSSNRDYAYNKNKSSSPKTKNYYGTYGSPLGKNGNLKTSEKSTEQKRSLRDRLSSPNHGFGYHIIQGIPNRLLMTDNPNLRQHSSKIESLFPKSSRNLTDTGHLIKNSGGKVKNSSSSLK